jgi:hypothetical protein
LLGSHRGGAMVQVLRASSVPWAPVPGPSGPGAGRAVVGAWPWAGWERGGWCALGVPIGPGASPLLTLRGRGLRRGTRVVSGGGSGRTSGGPCRATTSRRGGSVSAGSLGDGATMGASIVSGGCGAARPAGIGSAGAATIHSGPSVPALDFLPLGLPLTTWVDWGGPRCTCA